MNKHDGSGADGTTSSTLAVSIPPVVNNNNNNNNNDDGSITTPTPTPTTSLGLSIKDRIRAMNLDSPAMPSPSTQSFAFSSSPTTPTMTSSSAVTPTATEAITMWRKRRNEPTSTTPSSSLECGVGVAPSSTVMSEIISENQEEEERNDNNVDNGGGNNDNDDLEKEEEEDDEESPESWTISDLIKERNKVARSKENTTSSSSTTIGGELQKKENHQHDTKSKTKSIDKNSPSSSSTPPIQEENATNTNNPFARSKLRPVNANKRNALLLPPSSPSSSSSKNEDTNSVPSLQPSKAGSVASSQISVETFKLVQSIAANKSKQRGGSGSDSGSGGMKNEEVKPRIMIQTESNTKNTKSSTEESQISSTTHHHVQQQQQQSQARMKWASPPRPNVSDRIKAFSSSPSNNRWKRNSGFANTTTTTTTSSFHGSIINNGAATTTAATNAAVEKDSITSNNTDDDSISVNTPIAGSMHNTPARLGAQPPTPNSYNSSEAASSGDVAVNGSFDSLQQKQQRQTQYEKFDTPDVSLNDDNSSTCASSIMDDRGGNGGGGNGNKNKVGGGNIIYPIGPTSLLRSKLESDKQRAKNNRSFKMPNQTRKVPSILVAAQKKALDSSNVIPKWGNEKLISKKDSPTITSNVATATATTATTTSTNVNLKERNEMKSNIRVNDVEVKEEKIDVENEEPPTLRREITNNSPRNLLKTSPFILYDRELTPPHHRLSPNNNNSSNNNNNGVLSSAQPQTTMTTAPEKNGSIQNSSITDRGDKKVDENEVEKDSIPEDNHESTSINKNKNNNAKKRTNQKIISQISETESIAVRPSTKTTEEEEKNDLKENDPIEMKKKELKNNVPYKDSEKKVLRLLQEKQGSEIKESSVAMKDSSSSKSNNNNNMKLKGSVSSKAESLSKMGKDAKDDSRVERKSLEKIKERGGGSKKLKSPSSSSSEIETSTKSSERYREKLKANIATKAKYQPKLSENPKATTKAESQVRLSEKLKSKITSKLDYQPRSGDKPKVNLSSKTEPFAKLDKEPKGKVLTVEPRVKPTEKQEVKAELIKESKLNVPNKVTSQPRPIEKPNVTMATKTEPVSKLDNESKRNNSQPIAGSTKLMKKSDALKKIMSRRRRRKEIQAGKIEASEEKSNNENKPKAKVVSENETTKESVPGKVDVAKDTNNSDLDKRVNVRNGKTADLPDIDLPPLIVRSTQNNSSASLESVPQTPSPKSDSENSFTSNKSSPPSLYNSSDEIMLSSSTQSSEYDDKYPHDEDQYPHDEDHPEHESISHSKNLLGVDLSPIKSVDLSKHDYELETAQDEQINNATGNNCSIEIASPLKSQDSDLSQNQSTPKTANKNASTSPIEILDQITQMSFIPPPSKSDTDSSVSKALSVPILRNVTELVNNNSDAKSEVLSSSNMRIDKSLKLKYQEATSTREEIIRRLNGDKAQEPSKKNADDSMDSKFSPDFRDICDTISDTSSAVRSHAMSATSSASGVTSRSSRASRLLSGRRGRIGKMMKRNHDQTSPSEKTLATDLARRMLSCEDHRSCEPNFEKDLCHDEKEGQSETGVEKNEETKSNISIGTDLQSDSKSEVVMRRDPMHFNSFSSSFDIPKSECILPGVNESRISKRNLDDEDGAQLVSWVNNKLTNINIDKLATGISEKFEGGGEISSINFCGDEQKLKGKRDPNASYSSAVRISHLELDETPSDEEIAIEVEYIPKEDEEKNKIPMISKRQTSDLLSTIRPGVLPQHTGESYFGVSPNVSLSLDPAPVEKRPTAPISKYAGPDIDAASMRKGEPTSQYNRRY